QRFSQPASGSAACAAPASSTRSAAASPHPGEVLPVKQCKAGRRMASTMDEKGEARHSNIAYPADRPSTASLAILVVATPALPNPVHRHSQRPASFAVAPPTPPSSLPDLTPEPMP